MQNRYCLYCNEEFKDKRIDAKYCGNKCLKRMHYLQNREKYKQKAKDYALKYPEKRKEYVRRNNIKRKDVVKEYRKIYRVRLNKSARERRWRNIEQYRKKQKIIQKRIRNTPEGKLKMKEENKKRKFSKSVWSIRKKGYETANELKSQIIEKFKNVKNCIYCGGTKKLSLDHIIPLSKRGINEIDNFTIACMPCNTSKHNKNVVEWAKEKGIVLSNFIIDYVKSKKHDC